MGQIPHERIVFDPDIMMGKPTIEGPRITVELIFEELGEELAVEDLSRAHAHLAVARACPSGEGAGIGGPALRRRLYANEDVAFGSPEAA